MPGMKAKATMDRRSGAYRSWDAMKARCLNPKNNRFHLYGGRGISICDRWLKFSNFYEDMGDRPDGMSLERLDSNIGYELGNVIWATPKRQARTRRKTVKLILCGKERPLVELCEDYRIPVERIYHRAHKNGESHIEAFLCYLDNKMQGKWGRSCRG